MYIFKKTKYYYKLSIKDGKETYNMIYKLFGIHFKKGFKFFDTERKKFIKIYDFQDKKDLHDAFSTNHEDFYLHVNGIPINQVRTVTGGKVSVYSKFYTVLDGEVYIREKFDDIADIIHERNDELLKKGKSIVWRKLQ